MKSRADKLRWLENVATASHNPYSVHISISSPVSFHSIRVCPSTATSSCAAVSACSPSSCSSFVPSSRCFGPDGRRIKQARVGIKEFDVLASHCVLPLPAVNENQCSLPGRKRLISCGVGHREVEGKEDGNRIDLEAEIYDFMEKSGKPRHFPSKNDLIEAGRWDLVEAISSHGGWLAYGWDLDGEGEEPQTDCSRLPLHEANLGVDDEGLEFSLGCFNGRVHEHEKSSSSSTSSSGAPLESEDGEGGVDGILKRLEKERFLSYSDTSIGSKSKNSCRMPSKGDDPNHSVKDFLGNTKANGVKNFLSVIHHKSFTYSSGNATKGLDSSTGLSQYHTKSHLLLLESELSSVLGALRSRDDTILPLNVLNSKRTSVKEMHTLADLQEFVETEIMNTREKLRSTKAKISVLEGRMALQIIRLLRRSRGGLKQLKEQRVSSEQLTWRGQTQLQKFCWLGLLMAGAVRFGPFDVCPGLSKNGEIKRGGLLSTPEVIPWTV
ncbi:protein PTST homolog 2, chloroplastic-like isoform X2 [Wolffia australiana]